jgi:tetratricopeptide (TPR) repeat protein
MLIPVFLASLAIALALPQTEEVALRQIVVSSEQEALQLRQFLAVGAPFNGAYMGHMRLSDLRSEVRNALEPISPGKITQPVRVGNTYVIFQIVPEAESEWVDLDEGGAKALAEGRIADATAQFERALAQAEGKFLGDARVARSLDALADAYRIQGRAEDAEKLYRRALALLERMGAPELEVAQVLSGLGMSLAKQIRFAEAQALYERARSIRTKNLGADHPEVAATIRNLAEALAGLGRFAEAAKLYDQSQSLLEEKLGGTHPATIAAREGLASFQRSLTMELLERSLMLAISEFRDAKSLGDLRELLPITGLSEEVYLRVKDILFEAGLYDETEELLRAGAKKFPESRILRIYLADVLAATGRSQDALVMLQQIGRVPDPAQQAVIDGRIGDMHAAMSNLDAALAAYQRAGARVKSAKAYSSLGRLEEAIAELKRAAQDAPKNADVQLSLSEALVATGKWQEAAVSAERAIDLGVTDSRALYLLGTALVRMGRRDQGQERLTEFARVEAEFEAAAQRNREIGAISIAAAEALRAGDGKSAEEQLIRGTDRYRDSERLYMSLAVVQGRLGRHQPAIATLESMLNRRLGRSFLIHKMLAAEYETIGNIEMARQQRKTYLDAREAEARE